MRNAEANARKKITRILREAGQSVEQQLRIVMIRKDAGDDDGRNDGLNADDIDLSKIDEIRLSLLSDMELVAKDAGRGAVTNVGAHGANGLFDVVNGRAVAWAEGRAAELVTGLEQTTRDRLRLTIEKGLADNIGRDGIIDNLVTDYAFSADRAELIANTEIAMANSEGALIGYKAARDDGVKVKKEWLIAAEACDICQINAAAGAIDLDDEFPSGDDAPPGHPRCLCALQPVVED